MGPITAATKTAAEAVGLGDKTGTIQEGKLADVIVVDGDPSTNIDLLHQADKIKMVMKEGTVIITR